MEVRGYPVSNFERRVADVSVDHPAVAQNYRIAHGIALGHQQGEVSTEEYREAMIHYRALFAELLRDDRPEAAPEEEKSARRAA